MQRILAITLLYLLSSTLQAQAGMTVYDLTDVVRLRLEDISFFGLLLLLAGLGIRLLWNFLARDFPRLPRLTYANAFCLTILLSLAMLLVLVMISGAREILTPEAWRRQESHYRPNEIGNVELRTKHFENLRSVLLSYAQAHEGKFPPHDYVQEIPAALWESPDTFRTRYVYCSGISLGEAQALLVFEPEHFGASRFAMFGDGRVEKVDATEIHRLLRVRGSQTRSFNR